MVNSTLLECFFIYRHQQGEKENLVEKLYLYYLKCVGLYAFCVVTSGLILFEVPVYFTFTSTTAKIFFIVAMACLIVLELLGCYYYTHRAAHLQCPVCESSNILVESSPKNSFNDNRCHCGECSLSNTNIKINIFVNTKSNKVILEEMLEKQPTLFSQRETELIKIRLKN